MKKTHIIFLVLIAGTIAVLLTFLRTASTYDTMDAAIAKPGKFMHVAVRLDKSKPVDYNPTKDANFLSFHANPVENPKQSVRVVYRNGEIPNLMISERLILKGKYEGDHFECKDVQTKCPSKYKEEMKSADNNAGESSSQGSSTSQTEEKKY